VAHWLEGEPISDGVAVMAKIEDRHRSFCVDGEPVATGVAAVGDSWACTNPSVGRGSSIGLLHAIALRDHVRTAPLDQPLEFARAWHDATMTTVEPWYRSTLAYDRNRLGEIDAELEGRSYEPEDPGYGIGKALEVAAMRDPQALRAYLRVAGLLALPEDAVAAPGAFEAVLEVGDTWREAEIPAPDRAGLVEILEA
jgi:flavin-dependent dehydrogenase